MSIWNYWQMRHNCDETRGNRAIRWNGLTRENVDICQNNVSSLVNLDVRTGTGNIFWLGPLTKLNIIFWKSKMVNWWLFFIYLEFCHLNHVVVKSLGKCYHTYRSHIKRFRIKDFLASYIPIDIQIEKETSNCISVYCSILHFGLERDFNLHAIHSS